MLLCGTSETERNPTTWRLESTIAAAPRVAKESPRNILTDNGFRQLSICPENSEKLTVAVVANRNLLAVRGSQYPWGRIRKSKALIAFRAFLAVDLIAGSGFLLEIPRLERRHTRPDACGAIPKRSRQ